MKFNGMLIDAPVANMSPTFGRLEELNPLPRKPLDEILVHTIGPSAGLILPVQARPEKVRFSAPRFEIIIAADNPDTAACEPTTTPPKSTSGGEIVRKAV